MNNELCFISSSRSDERIVPDEVISSMTLRVGLQQSHSYPSSCKVISAMNYILIVNEKDKHGPRFTFKGGPDGRIAFDSVRLWKGEE